VCWHGQCMVWWYEQRLLQLSDQAGIRHPVSLREQGSLLARRHRAHLLLRCMLGKVWRQRHVRCRIRNRVTATRAPALACKAGSIPRANSPQTHCDALETGMGAYTPMPSGGGICPRPMITRTCDSVPGVGMGWCAPVPRAWHGACRVQGVGQGGGARRVPTGLVWGLPWASVARPPAPPAPLCSNPHHHTLRPSACVACYGHSWAPNP